MTQLEQFLRILYALFDNINLNNIPHEKLRLLLYTRTYIIGSKRCKARGNLKFDRFSEKFS